MYTIQNKDLTVTITKDGAELVSIIYKGKEYLYQGDKTWKRRAPILFPWAGRLRNLEYTYDGKTYHLAQHGFARDKVFAVTEEKEESIKMEITSDPSTLSLYPRPFRFIVEYKVEGNSLLVSATVVNTGDKEMTYGIGIHPGFIMNDENATLELMGENRGGIFLDKDGTETGEEAVSPTLPLSFFHDSKTLIVPKSKGMVVKSKDRNVEINLTSWPNLVVWRSGDDPFICLEAWANLPSKKGEEENFNTRSNTVSTQPYSTSTFSCSFSFL